MINLSITQILAATLIMLLLLTLETVMPFITGRKHRIKSAIRNSGIGIFNAIFTGLFVSILLVLTTSWVESHSIGLFNLVELPILVSAFMGVVLLDAWMYIWHRVNHGFSVLWRFHKVHHSDSEMDVTTSVRFHTGEILIGAFLRLGVVLVLGLSLWQVLLYDLLLIPFVFFQHSNISFPEKWDRYLRVLFASPAMHRIHHSSERIETDSNYGSIFSFWDRFAHSFRVNGNRKKVQYGLKEYDPKESGQLLTLALMPFYKSTTRSSVRQNERETTLSSYAD